MTLFLSATAQALLFTGGCRLIHANRLRAELVGTVLVALVTVLVMALSTAVALTLIPPSAVSDAAIRACDPSFDLLADMTDARGAARQASLSQEALSRE